MAAFKAAKKFSSSPWATRSFKKRVYNLAISIVLRRISLMELKQTLYQFLSCSRVGVILDSVGHPSTSRRLALVKTITVRSTAEMKNKPSAVVSLTLTFVLAMLTVRKLSVISASSKSTLAFTWGHSKVLSKLVNLSNQASHIF